MACIPEHAGIWPTSFCGRRPTVSRNRRSVTPGLRMACERSGTVGRAEWGQTPRVIERKVRVDEGLGGLAGPIVMERVSMRPTDIP